MADARYSYRKLILPLDGVDGSTVFTDYSSSPKTATSGGGIAISTTKSWGGGASLKTGSGKYIAYDDCDLGNGDFTIEGRVLWDSNSNGGLFHFTTGTLPSGNYGLAVGNYPGAGGLEIIFNGSVYVATYTVPLDAQKHFALVRLGTTLTLYMGGVSIWSTTTSLDFSSFTRCYIGLFGNGSTLYYHNGYIDDFRSTTGAAEYTSNFTPSSVPNPTTNAESGTAALFAPMPSLLSGGGPTPSSISASLTAPSPTLTVHGGANFRPLTAPSPTLYATGHNSTGEQAANLSAPRPQFSAQGGGNTRLTAPRPQLDASATVTRLASIDLSAPRPVMSATGRASEAGSAYLTAPMASIKAYGGGLVSVTGPMGTVQASGTTGSIGRASVSCPLFELTADGHTENYGSANLIAPSPKLGATIQAYLIAPMGKLTAIGSAVVTATYEAYAVNLNHAADAPSAVTRYTNYPFTHVVCYQGSYFGVAEGKLYLLEGTTDSGTAIPFAVETHKTDFGKPELKTLVSAYFGGRLGPAETITLLAGERFVQPQDFTTPRGTAAQTYRQKFGLGNRERYYALGMSGEGPFKLDAIDVEVATLKRRI